MDPSPAGASEFPWGYFQLADLTLFTYL